MPSIVASPAFENRMRDPSEASSSASTTAGSLIVRRMGPTLNRAFSMRNPPGLLQPLRGRVPEESLQPFRAIGHRCAVHALHVSNPQPSGGLFHPHDAEFGLEDQRAPHPHRHAGVADALLFVMFRGNRGRKAHGVIGQIRVQAIDDRAKRGRLWRAGPALSAGMH